MAVVNFTLSEEGVVALQNVLACMLKFSDDVCLEAKKDKLMFTALNSSKSAYVSFTFAANRFFSKYNFEGNAQYRERFFCSIYIRALLSVFRSRIGGDPSREREKETTIERCEVTIDDGPGRKSRLVAKIICRNGITATHGLPFEVKAPTRAKFDPNEAVNHWAISSRTLRQLMEHFGPKIELLDINTDGEGVVNFACFTEKQYVKTEGESIDHFLNKPLHTSIAVEMDEFDDIEVEDKLHIIISVKDFRAILHHAGLTSGELSASYSVPGRPFKLSYSGDGILCEFILMTVGERGNPGQRTKRSRTKSARPMLEAASTRSASVVNEATPAPPAAAVPTQPPADVAARPIPPRNSQFDMRPPPLPPVSTLRSESMFMPQDDDQQWEPVNPEDEEEEEVARLEWDTSNEPDPSAMRLSSHFNTQNAQQTEPPPSLPAGLEPTQRLSEVRKYGLFSG